MKLLKETSRCGKLVLGELVFSEMASWWIGHLANWLKANVSLVI